MELIEVDIERPVKAERGRDGREDLSNQPAFKFRSTQLIGRFGFHRNVLKMYKFVDVKNHLIFGEW